MGGAAIRSSERPRATQAPIFFPPRELSVAKLQREGGIDGVEAGNARRSVGEIDLRASPSGVIDERHAQRERSLLGGHAENERGRVGLSSAKGGPADPKRNTEPFESQCSCLRAARRLTTGAPSSIHLRNPVKLVRNVWSCATTQALRWRNNGADRSRRPPSARSAELSHSAAMSCPEGSSQLCTPADFVPQHTYQEPNRNSSISNASAIAARSFQGRMKGLPRRVCFISQRPKGSASLPPRPYGSLPSMMTMRPPGRRCFQAWRSTAMRHRIVAKAEHDAVERLAGNVLDGVALGQFDVRP